VLFQATLLIDLTAMATCLWMAFYLFARGFPSPITTRGAVLLLALSAFFFGAYNNLFEQIPGTAALRAACLIAGMGAWHDATLQLLPKPVRKRHRPWSAGIYLLGLTTIILLVTSKGSFVGEQGNTLNVARMGVGLPYILYGVFELAVFSGIFYNLLAYNRVGFTTEGRYFLFATLITVAGLGYGLIALAISPPLPRIGQDLSIFLGVFIIAISVARHQTLVERRTTLQDFPITSLTMLLLASTYALIAIRFEHPLELVGPIVAFVILTHALYDLVREFLERLRRRNESQFRKQLRRLENAGAEETLRLRLQEGLDLLCQTIHASNGFIAIKREKEFVVVATRQSVPLERCFPASTLAYDDVIRAENAQIPNIQYFAPSFDGQNQIAVMGIGAPNMRLDYSRDDLNLLSEVADQIGTIVSLGNIQPQIKQILKQSEINESEANAVVDEMLSAIGINPDAEFIKVVEDGLRHLSDYIFLGQSPLADKLEVQAESQVERGRDLHQKLLDAIDILKPAEKRPPEPLPRLWYNHAVLHDAYVEGAPNREIMARLYISEGTFNRTRRNAIRGLARLLLEKYPAK